MATGLDGMLSLEPSTASGSRDASTGGTTFRSNGTASPPSIGSLNSWVSSPRRAVKNTNLPSDDQQPRDSLLFDLAGAKVSWRLAPLARSTIQRWRCAPSAVGSATAASTKRPSGESCGSSMARVWRRSSLSGKRGLRSDDCPKSGVDATATIAIAAAIALVRNEEMDRIGRLSR